jgi:NAD(P)-dependent dehydrogenase (short-subunit alcohol dehydrogenase family)
MRTEIRVPDSFPVPLDVKARRVVITGGSRGLGRVLAAAFVNAGAKVALVARNQEDLEAASRQLDGDVLVWSGDVSEPDFNEHVAGQVVDRWGGLDVWIANAGVSPAMGGPLDIEPAVWRRVVDVNLNAVFFGARAATRVMDSGGRIIVTASVLGERPRSGLAAYSASKAGAIALTKSLALDLAPMGITVNAVAPGWFDSPLAESWRRNPQLEQHVLAHTALGRWGQSEDLPGAYLFLASDAAAYVTGAVLAVDGGYLCV